MKILYSEGIYSKKIGGGYTKLMKLKEYLTKSGITVDLFNPWEMNLEDYDICHHFTSFKWDLPFVQYVKSTRVKLVLEPMYWYDFHFALHIPVNNWKMRLKEIIGYGVKIVFPLFPSARRKVFLTADMLMVNSELERNNLSRLFAVPEEKIFVAYNGADSTFAEATPDLFIERFGLKDFLLVVGWFDVRKNQLNFIRAMKSIDIPIVFIGDAVPGCLWYYEICREEATPNMHFVGTFKHSDPVFASAYAAADTLVMPSLCETPGKVALEAALAGAKLVITPRGSTKEYFKDFAAYVKPNNLKEMRRLVLETYEKPKDGVLRQHVLNNYTWEIVIEQRIKGYQLLMEK